MTRDWIVARAGEMWQTRDGVFCVTRVALARWRLTEVVRDFTSRGRVKLLVMEHDRDFYSPREAASHVACLLDQMREVA